MFVLKSLASHGDFRTWTAYACNGSGQGQAVRAEIAPGVIAVTIAGRAYDCEIEESGSMDRLSVGVIRRIMLAVLAIDADRFLDLKCQVIHTPSHPSEISLAQVG